MLHKIIPRKIFKIRRLPMSGKSDFSIDVLPLFHFFNDLNQFPRQCSKTNLSFHNLERYIRDLNYILLLAFFFIKRFLLWEGIYLFNPFSFFGVKKNYLWIIKTFCNFCLCVRDSRSLYYTLHWEVGTVMQRKKIYHLNQSP